jgi:hypothetical protein
MLNRRRFLRTGAATVAAAMISRMPASVLAGKKTAARA